MEVYPLSGEIDRPKSSEEYMTDSLRLINLYFLNGDIMVIYDSFESITAKLNSLDTFICVDVVYSDLTEDVLDLYTEMLNKSEILCTGHVCLDEEEGKSNSEGHLFAHKLKPKSQIFIGDMAIPVLESYEEIIDQIDIKSDALTTESSPIKDQSLEITTVSDEGKAGRILLRPHIMHGIADMPLDD